jgi:hypothetical protein
LVVSEGIFAGVGVLRLMPLSLPETRETKGISRFASRRIPGCRSHQCPTRPIVSADYLESASVCPGQCPAELTAACRSIPAAYRYGGQPRRRIGLWKRLLALPLLATLQTSTTSRIGGQSLPHASCPGAAKGARGRVLRAAAPPGPALLTLDDAATRLLQWSSFRDKA